MELAPVISNHEIPDQNSGREKKQSTTTASLYFAADRFTSYSRNLLACDAAAGATAAGHTPTARSTPTSATAHASIPRAARAGKRSPSALTVGASSVALHCGFTPNWATLAYVRITPSHVTPNAAATSLISLTVTLACGFELVEVPITATRESFGTTSFRIS